jgi:hypothetical protein
MKRQQRRVGVWDLLWAPVAVVAGVTVIMALRVPGPYLQFIIIAGFAATVVEVGRWLSQARRDRQDRSSVTDAP